MIKFRKLLNIKLYKKNNKIQPFKKSIYKINKLIKISKKLKNLNKVIQLKPQLIIKMNKNLIQKIKKNKKLILKHLMMKKTKIINKLI